VALIVGMAAQGICQNPPERLPSTATIVQRIETSEEFAPPTPADKVRFVGSETAGLLTSAQETLPVPSAAGPDDIGEAIAYVRVIPTQGEPQVIDLETAWRLAGVQNPTINVARMTLVEAQAMQRQAQLVWVPNLTGGTNWRNHQGALQSSFGQIRNVDLNSAYVGAGARTVAAETIGIPGIRLLTQVADALYEPLAARQRTAAQRFDNVATNNDVLLDTTVAYLQLMAAEARLEALQATYHNMHEVVETTASYAAVGQGREGDAERARGEGLLTLRRIRAAEEEAVIASAGLARLLHLDPSVQLKTPGGELRTFDLVDMQRSMPDLIEVAQRYRPEIFARSMDIEVGRTRVRQEQVRPLLPLLSIGYSAGGFGGTGNFLPTIGPFTSLNPRTDFDVWCVWTLQNMGAGNIASANRRRGELGIAQGQRLRVINQVRAEVVDAYASAIAQRRQLNISRRQLAEAEAAFREDYTRLRAAEALPLEVLISARLLEDARLDLINVFVRDNEAQFRLFVAMGQPPYRATMQYEASKPVPPAPEPVAEEVPPPAR
jgi:outer membrane protein TolC